MAFTSERFSEVLGECERRAGGVWGDTPPVNLFTKHLSGAEAVTKQPHQGRAQARGQGGHGAGRPEARPGLDLDDVQLAGLGRSGS